MAGYDNRRGHAAREQRRHGRDRRASTNDTEDRRHQRARWVRHRFGLSKDADEGRHERLKHGIPIRYLNRVERRCGGVAFACRAEQLDYTRSGFGNAAGAHRDAHDRIVDNGQILDDQVRIRHEADRIDL